MSSIDNAINALQAHALEISGIKAAPQKPVSDAGVLPIAIAYISDGNATPSEASFTREFYTLNVDFHVARISLSQAYTQLNAIIPAYFRKLSGDPTLGGAVDTIVFPASVTVSPTQWDNVVTQMAQFSIQVKVLGTPTT